MLKFVSIQSIFTSTSGQTSHLFGGPILTRHTGPRLPQSCYKLQSMHGLGVTHIHDSFFNQRIKDVLKTNERIKLHKYMHQ